MAATDYGVNAPEAVKLWSKALAREALSKTYIGQFIGQTPDSLIQEKTETKKSAGDRVTITLRTQLSGDGVTEGETLEGAEEALSTYTDNLFINELAHAVRSRSKISRQRVPFQVREEGKEGLADWFAGRMDTWFFNQVCGYTPANTAGVGSGPKYAGLNPVSAPSATRIVRPAALTTDQAVQADNTAVFSLALLDKAVHRAKTSAPILRPINVGKGRKKFVAFIHTDQVYQLRQAVGNSQWLDIQKAAVSGGDLTENPIYSGALGEYNNCVLHEATRVTNGVHSTTGAAQTSVRRAVLCGAQAAAIGFGKGQGFDAWDWIEDEFDYEREFGVSAQTIAGLKKLVFNGVDFGTIVMSSYAVAP
jgi:N4-gp56 family major capsid protein